MSNSLAYTWFRQQTPSATLNGGALLLYDVPPFELTWVAQCDSPGPPLALTTIIEQTGQPAVRALGFDCAQTWVYPMGGRTAGIYTFDEALFTPPQLQLPEFLFGNPTPTEAFLQRHLQPMRLSFAKRHQDVATPAFVLYESTAPPPGPSYPPIGNFAPIELPPLEAQSLGQWGTAAHLENRLAFLGIVFTATPEVWEVETWWQVKVGPLERPFSIMAHLVSADGYVQAVADGLGVSPLALRPGDIVVQRHRFPKPPEGQAYWLRTGAYWLDNLERWQVDEAAPADTLLIPLNSGAGQAAEP
jgi:hypothetical protein